MDRRGARQRLLVAPVLVAVLLVSMLSGASAKPTRGAAGWDAFMGDRKILLETLSPAFESCFKRRDSLVDPLSPIFHGCLDWHSAVHAAYSHHVLYRRTGDERYLRLIDDQFAPQGVSLIPLEEAYERAKAPDLPLTENPYGFGWFLLLAREREASTKSTDLRGMADFAAAQMVEWFDARLATGQAEQYVLDAAHANYSWSLMNLDTWADYTQDEALRKAVDRASEALVTKSVDDKCNLEVELQPTATGFQSPCFMRLAALAQIRGASARPYVTKRLPRDLRIEPVTKPAGCHAGGLNFTRAFGLWRLFELTGDVRYRDNYAELVRYHVGRPDLYEGEAYFGEPDYLCYSHWVAQLGVRAISLSY